jgi:methionyl-tRNA formyltransferase
MKVVIIGSGMLLANVIEGVLDAGDEIVGVLRKKRAWWKNSPGEAGCAASFSPEATIIKEYKFHEIKCKSANSECFRQELLRRNVDVLIVATWHELLKKEVFDLPTLASINIHPSLLPKYRGPNPYLETIRHQETQTGVTIHLIDENFDSGAILAQEKIDILPGYTGKELREQTVFRARYLVSAVLKKFGEIVPVPQDEEKSSYYPAIDPTDMILDFENKTSEQIHAQIRAFHPWYPCYIKYNNKFYIANPYKLRLVDACGAPGEVVAHERHSLTVVCKDSKAIKLNHGGKWKGLFP